MTLLLPEASLAKTSHAREKAREYAAKEADCGRSMRVSFAKYDPVSCLWRIPHFLFQEDWATFSQTWPRWGMMVHGECYQLPPWVQDTGVTVFGEPSGDGIEDGRRFYCTPTTVEAKPSAKSWHKNPTVGDVVAEEREKIRAQSARPTVTVHGNANKSDYGGKSGDGLETAVKKAAEESATGPTPTCCGLDGGSNSRRAAKRRGRYIERGEPSATGPTPTVHDRMRGQIKPHGREIHAGYGTQGNLNDEVVRRASSATGPTPKCRDCAPTSKNQKPRDDLKCAVEMGQTKSHFYPTVGTQTMGGCSGSFAKLKHLEEIGRQTPEECRAMSSHLTGGKDPAQANVGLLNPDWVEWLMGWPYGWTDIDKTSLDELAWLDLSDDPAEWLPPLMPRITTRKEHRTKRIETLGNGQVPLCAAVALIYGMEILRVALKRRKA